MKLNHFIDTQYSVARLKHLGCFLNEPDIGDKVGIGALATLIGGQDFRPCNSLGAFRKKFGKERFSPLNRLMKFLYQWKDDGSLSYHQENYLGLEDQTVAAFLLFGAEKVIDLCLSKQKYSLFSGLDQVGAVMRVFEIDKNEKYVANKWLPGWDSYSSYVSSRDALPEGPLESFGIVLSNSSGRSKKRIHEKESLPWEPEEMDDFDKMLYCPDQFDSENSDSDEAWPKDYEAVETPKLKSQVSLVTKRQCEDDSNLPRQDESTSKRRKLLEPGIDHPGFRSPVFRRNPPRPRML